MASVHYGSDYLFLPLSVVLYSFSRCWNLPSWSTLFAWNRNFFVKCSLIHFIIFTNTSEIIMLCAGVNEVSQYLTYVMTGEKKYFKKYLPNQRSLIPKQSPR